MWEIFLNLKDGGGFDPAHHFMSINQVMFGILKSFSVATTCFSKHMLITSRYCNICEIQMGREKKYCKDYIGKITHVLTHSISDRQQTNTSQHMKDGFQQPGSLWLGRLRGLQVAISHRPFGTCAWEPGRGHFHFHLKFTLTIIPNFDIVFKVALIAMLLYSAALYSASTRASQGR